MRTIEQQRWFATGESAPSKGGDKSASGQQGTREINTADKLIAFLGKRLEKIVEQLAAKLDDSNRATRIKAARQLMQMGAAAQLALPQLQKMAGKDPDVTTRRAAGIAVRQISKARDDTLLWYENQGKTSKKSFTVNQVNALRKSTGFDKQAKSIGGITAVGTGGNGPNNAWIIVICENTQSVVRARKLLGDQHKGVPIRYSVSGPIRKQ